MADAMRAATVTDFSAPLSITEWEIPEPGLGEVLVRLRTGGVCHTDTEHGQIDGRMVIRY
ncbi:hypothetical protein [Mumia quercus]|uniref:hypothetical protein n=1 Tax=Mumia quercus TaxID=2976125 RepID=UPI0021D1E4F5|nr:hypothetical protein [Mumia quercus]